MAIHALSGRLRDEDKEMVDAEEDMQINGEGYDFSSGVSNTDRRRRIVRFFTTYNTRLEC